MNTSVHYFFLGSEVIVNKIIESFHLAKVSYLASSEMFFVDLSFISIEHSKQESSLSLAVLGGVQ